ncbi:glutathione transferase GstA [Noviherbaspirillum sp. UKPF54]|uniref:glutathione transferase GstA n=1 Tax=Noviherbaspirillum sp. UKPF54 TaxID=2601898 RepID=UPI0011B17D41|nr:glutathione transferase GstA [Noviherbaspirillum sp. UKPF54]QDZ29612.1 glutathione transferase GstA [Noviherbaspirillum sp. UKPF54]
MKLYYSPGACSMAPHIVALEAGLKMELVKVDIPNKKTESGDDFWKINPKGYVPALVLDNGELITEVAVICQYLADQAPASGLAAALGTMERYQLMSALNFVATEVHKQIGALFNPALTAEMRVVQTATITRRLNTLDQMLAGRAFMMGERFTVADAYLFTVLNWTRFHKIDLGQWQNIPGYMARVAGREKVKQAMREEGLPA